MYIFPERCFYTCTVPKKLLNKKKQTPATEKSGWTDIEWLYRDWIYTTLIIHYHYITNVKITILTFTTEETSIYLPKIVRYFINF